MVLYLVAFVVRSVEVTVTVLLEMILELVSSLGVMVTTSLGIAVQWQTQSTRIISSTKNISSRGIRSCLTVSRCGSCSKSSSRSYSNSNCKLAEVAVKVLVAVLIVALTYFLGAFQTSPFHSNQQWMLSRR